MVDWLRAKLPAWAAVSSIVGSERVRIAYDYTQIFGSEILEKEGNLRIEILWDNS